METKVYEYKATGWVAWAAAIYVISSILMWPFILAIGVVAALNPTLR